MKRIKYYYTKFIKGKIIFFRQSLERNKIFFEIISSIFLVCASIMISFASNQISERTKEIYERQLEILENDREPYFLLKSESIDGVYQGSDYNYTKQLYTIKNEGGLITGACALPVYTEIKMTVFNKGLGKRNS